LELQALAISRPQNFDSKTFGKSQVDELLDTRIIFKWVPGNEEVCLSALAGASLQWYDFVMTMVILSVHNRKINKLNTIIRMTPIDFTD
jgi:hypothetical protein